MAEQLQAAITFADVQKQPEFANLKPEQQQEVAIDFFSKRVASRPEYQKLKPEQQQEVQIDFQTKYKFTPIKPGEINTELAAQNGTTLTPQSELGIRPQQEAALQPRQPAQPENNPIIDQLQGFGRGLAKGASAGSLYAGEPQQGTEFSTGAGDFIGSAATNLLPYLLNPVAGVATNAAYAGLREANREIDQGKAQLNPLAIGAQTALGAATGLLPVSLGARAGLRVASGAALGGLAGASGNAIEQLTDNGNIDLGQLAPSALTGLVLGAGAGALNRAGRNAIPRQERVIGLNKLSRKEIAAQQVQPEVRGQVQADVPYQAEVKAEIVPSGSFDDAPVQPQEIFNSADVLEMKETKLGARVSLKAMTEDVRTTFQKGSNAGDVPAIDVLESAGYSLKRAKGNRVVSFLGKPRVVKPTDTIGGFLNRWADTPQDPHFALAKSFKERGRVGALEDYKRLNQGDSSEQNLNEAYSFGSEENAAMQSEANLSADYGKQQKEAYAIGQKALNDLDTVTTQQELEAAISTLEPAWVGENLPESYWNAFNDKLKKASDAIENPDSLLRSYTPEQKKELEESLDALYGKGKDAVPIDSELNKDLNIKERGFSKSVREAVSTPKRIKDYLTKNPNEYVVKTMAETEAEARAFIKAVGGAEKAALTILRMDKLTDSSNAAAQFAGEMLYKEADELLKQGKQLEASAKYDLGADLTDFLATKGTLAGRAINAFRFIQKTPEAAVRYAQRTVNRAKEQVPQTVKAIEKDIQKIKKVVDDGVNNLAQEFKSALSGKNTKKIKEVAEQISETLETAGVKKVKKLLASFTQEELDALGREVGC